MKNVIISFPIESDWYEKYGSRTYEVTTLESSGEKFAFSLSTEDYFNDKLLMKLANSAGTVDAAQVKLSYTTDDVYVQFKRLFSLNHVFHSELGYTAFVFEYIKN